MVRDYDIGQVWDILSDLDPNVEEAKIRESKHVMKSFDLRSSFLDRKIVYDSLINKNPVLIGKSDLNSFKLIYEHPEKSGEDIYVIISLDDNENILLVTYIPIVMIGGSHHHERP